MKKLKWTLYILTGLVVLAWLTATALMYWVLPNRRVQNFVQQQITEAVGLPVQLESVGLRWTGLVAKNVRLLENEKDAKPIFSIKKLVLRGAPWKLLRGQINIREISIQNPVVYLVREQDGSWNIDKLNSNSSDSQEASQTPAEPVAETDDKDSFFLQLQIYKVHLTQGYILFEDRLNAQTVEISKLFFKGENIDSEHSFPLYLQADAVYQQLRREKQKLHLDWNVLADFKGFRWEESVAELKKVILDHAGGHFVLSGKVKNWTAPQMQLTLSGTGISDKLTQLAGVDTPAFSLDKISIGLDAAFPTAEQEPLRLAALDVRAGETKLYDATGKMMADIMPWSAHAAGKANLEKMTATISSFTINAFSSTLSSTGTISWGPKKTSFQTAHEANLDLAVINKQLAFLTPYQLEGFLQGKAAISSDQWSGKVQASQLGATVAGVGRLSGVQFVLSMPDKTKFSVPDIKGKINEGEFTGSLSGTYTDTAITANLKAQAPRLALPPVSKSDDSISEGESAAADTTTENTTNTYAWPPIALRADIDIGSLDAPFIAANNLQLKANLKQITPLLDQTDGTISLDLGKGEIKDMNQLTQANILTRVLFGSLGAVSRVINSLNVLSVLNGIGSGLINTVTGGNKEEEQMVVQTIQDEEGNDVHILVPASSVRSSGDWAFEKFATALNFNDGVADVEKGLFASDMISFRLKGNMNFKTRALNMKVQAAPGLHLEDGIMPLTLKIGGTLDEPSGSMSLSSTVTSVIGQTLTNNFAARTAKKGISSVVGIFKKKENKDALQDADESELEGIETQETPAGESPQEKDSSQPISADEKIVP